MTQSFTVEMTMTRTVKVVVEASSEAEARSKAANLDYQYCVDGEVLHSKIVDVSLMDVSPKRFV